MHGLTVEEFKRYVDVESDRDDDILTRRLNAALAALGRHTRRRLHPWPALVPADPQTDPPTFTDTAPAVTFQRRIRGPRGGRFVRVPDVREVVSVVADGTETEDYWLVKAHEDHPDDWPHPIIELARSARVVDVTGRFGWLDFDDELEDAIYTIAAHRHWSAETGSADATRSSEHGDRVWLKQFPTPIQVTINNLIVPDDRVGLG